MKPKLIIVAGKNLLESLAGGHPAYVRTWAHVAVQSGYTPEIFSISHGETSETVTPFGTMHTVRSPMFWVPDKHKKSFGSNTLIFHVNILAKHIASFAQKDPNSTYIIHGMGVWNAAAERATAMLRKEGIKCKSVVTAYTTLRHEYKSKWKGLTNEHGFKALMRYSWEMFVLNIYLDRAERKAYLSSDLVLVNYDSVREILWSQWGPHPNIQKIAYSTEAEMLQKQTSSKENVTQIISKLSSPDAPLLMTVSRHDPRKGLDTFIRSLAILKQKEVPFRACLIGSGPLFDSYKKMVQSLGMEDSVVFSGFVDDVIPYLEKADIFVLPSYEEGSGSVSMLEAMRSGKAIVASDLDGIPEDVSNRESAILVPPRDKVALADSLEELIMNPDLRHKLGAAAKSVFKERFSREVLLKAVRELYDNIKS